MKTLLEDHVWISLFIMIFFSILAISESCKKTDKQMEMEVCNSMSSDEMKMKCLDKLKPKPLL